MARLITGDYNGIFFDSYGEKQRLTKQVRGASYIRMLVKCRRYMKIRGFHSFRVDRAIFNSLDNTNKWQ